MSTVNTLNTCSDTLPAQINSVEELEDLLSQPQQALIDDLTKIDGDIIIIGVGGKVGPTLARMAKRAAPHKRVIGVARFSDPEVKARLESWDIECLPCELTNQEEVQKLPQVANVIYMAGKKFGTAGEEHFTWAMNAVVPTYVADHFSKSRDPLATPSRLGLFRRVARGSRGGRDFPRGVASRFGDTRVATLRPLWCDYLLCTHQVNQLALHHVQ